ncbi:hypothetical protein L7F22_067911 [Adiantum nelumboides]|nr:hypothetical protein [Adiantum nelumboides]
MEKMFEEDENDLYVGDFRENDDSDDNTYSDSVVDEVNENEADDADDDHAGTNSVSKTFVSFRTRRQSKFNMAASMQIGSYGNALADEAGLEHHEIAPPPVEHSNHSHIVKADQKNSSSNKNNIVGTDADELTAKPDVQEKILREGEEDGLDYNVTDEDRATLRRVPAPIPWTAYLIGFCELAERFSYYGTTQVFQNMIQYPLPAGSTTGQNPDLNRNPVSLVEVNKLLLALPLSTLSGSTSILYLAVTSLIRTGVDSTRSALVLIKAKRQYIKVNKKTGERLIVDPTATAARLYDFFYMAINVGAIAGQIAMPFTEKYYGKIFGQPTRWYKNMRADDFWENVKPSKLGAEKPTWMTFDDQWVEEVRRGFKACYVFILFPFYWLVYNQISGNLISQGGSMALHGVPNEIPQNLDPLSIIVMVPTFEFLIYPALRRMGINFTALKKIFTGFFVASFAMVWAAVLQHFIYKTSPCGNYASDCQAGNSPLSVWIQVGPYFFIGLSELFASVVSLEYAFTKAPKNMRSLVMGVGLFTNAIGSALQEAFLPLSTDPLLVWMYTTFACIAFVAGIAFGIMYRSTDAEEDRLNNLATATYNNPKKAPRDEEWDMHSSSNAPKFDQSVSW